MCPQPDCLQRLVFFHACRQQDDSSRAVLLAHLPEHCQAILAGHTDVQDQHIRLEVLHGLESFCTIPTAGEELEIWFQAKELLQGIENERVVISHYEANWHSCAPDRPSGTVIDRQALVAVESMVRSPPRDAARSRWGARTKGVSARAAEDGRKSCMRQRRSCCSATRGC